MKCDCLRFSDYVIDTGFLEHLRLRRLELLVNSSADERRVVAGLGGVVRGVLRGVLLSDGRPLNLKRSDLLVVVVEGYFTKSITEQCAKILRV